MSSSEARSLLRELSPNEVILRDEKYRAISLKDFNELIMRSRPRTLETYRKEIFDCDNATVCFMADIMRGWANLSYGEEALAFGYISAVHPSGNMHAFIWQIDDQGSINFIEPQTNGGIDWKPIGITCIEA